MPHDEQDGAGLFPSLEQGRPMVTRSRTGWLEPAETRMPVLKILIALHDAANFCHAVPFDSAQRAITKTAQATPWVTMDPSLKPCKGRSIRSIPHIPFVVRHLVSFQKRTKLLLKRALSMVLLLPLDVLDHLSYVGLADRKGPVATLPVEVSKNSSFGLDPFRRIFFHALDYITQGMVF